MNKLLYILVGCYSSIIFCQYDLDEITPYKFNSIEELAKSSYVAPSSARFSIKRKEVDAPEIVYYLSKPRNVDNYPIAILCTGSTSNDCISSVIHFHRYLLQEFLDLKIAVITIEQWGVDGNNINKDIFLSHYTRSQRLKDHQNVIEHLQSNYIKGWNGKLIFLGVSEGGPLVTSLTELYPENIIATINWCGAGDWSWREELWVFIEDMRRNGPWWLKLWNFMPSWLPFSFKIPKSKDSYDVLMDQILTNPCVDKEFMGMTYKYHADALLYPKTDYPKLKIPFLVVAGTKDSIVLSSDCFVQKAREAGANITYFRVEGMDHYVRRRPDIVEQSFEWLKNILTDSSK